MELLKTAPPVPIHSFPTADSLFFCCFNMHYPVLVTLGKTVYYSGLITLPLSYLIPFCPLPKNLVLRVLPALNKGLLVLWQILCTLEIQGNSTIFSVWKGQDSKYSHYFFSHVPKYIPREMMSFTRHQQTLVRTSDKSNHCFHK